MPPSTFSPHPQPSPLVDVEGAELLVLKTVDLSVTNVHFFLIELDGSNKEKDAALRAHLSAAGFVKNPLLLRDGCTPRSPLGCMPNELWENKEYAARKRAREAAAPTRLYHYGTGVRCDSEI